MNQTKKTRETQDTTTNDSSPASMRVRCGLRAGFIVRSLVEYNGIDGESTDDAHDKWIDVLD